MVFRCVRHLALKRHELGPGNLDRYEFAVRANPRPNEGWPI